MRFSCDDGIWDLRIFLRCIGEHTTVWGSFYDPETKRWGYKCCALVVILAGESCFRRVLEMPPVGIIFGAGRSLCLGDIFCPEQAAAEAMCLKAKARSWRSRASAQNRIKSQVT